MKSDIREIRLNFAIVVNADIDTIEHIQDFLADIPKCRVIYQRSHAGKLFIKEGEQ